MANALAVGTLEANPPSLTCGHLPREHPRCESAGCLSGQDPDSRSGAIALRTGALQREIVVLNVVGFGANRLETTFALVPFDRHAFAPPILRPKMVVTEFDFSPNVLDRE